MVMSEREANLPVPSYNHLQYVYLHTYGEVFEQVKLISKLIFAVKANFKVFAGFIYNIMSNSVFHYPPVFQHKTLKSWERGWKRGCIPSLCQLNSKFDCN